MPAKSKYQKDMFTIPDTFFDLLKTESRSLNPTLIFNEGWMTRQLVQISIQQKLVIKEVDFGAIGNWCTEGLLASPFLALSRSDSHAEGYTHADLICGDVTYNFDNSGEVKLLNGAATFGVIEAKMKSNLSQKVSKATDYNQASRNLACMAMQMADVKSDVFAFFGVSAPASMIEFHELEKQISLKETQRQISNRFDKLPEGDPRKENRDTILKKAATIRTFVVSYEDWIDQILGEEKLQLQQFYRDCLRFNSVN